MEAFEKLCFKRFAFQRYELFRAVVLNISWFVAPFQRLSTLVAPCSSIGFCNITAEQFG